MSPFKESFDTKNKHGFSGSPSMYENAPKESQVEQDSEVVGQRIEPEPWKPDKRLYAAIVTLCVITLMVALDTTDLSITLPVSTTHQ